MDFLKLPVFAYALLKFKIKMLPNLINNNVVTVLLTLLALIIIYPIIILLISYKQIVNLILLRKFGAKYRGLLDGLDSMIAREQKCVVNVISFIEHSGGSEGLIEAFQRRFQDISDRKIQEKLFFVKNTFLGFNYYLRHEFKPSEIVRPMQKMDLKAFDKKACMAALQIEDQRPMPCNDTGLIEIVVGQQAVNFEPFTTKPTYPVIFRIHHSLGDGVSILNVFCSQLLGKDLPEKTITFVDQVKDKLLEMKLVTASTEMKSDASRMLVKNVLQTFDCLGDKQYVWYSEFQHDIMAKIHRIRKFYNTAFASVLNACFATALYEYYKKRTVDIPEKVVSGVVYVPKPVVFDYGNMCRELGNTCTAVGLEFPIKLKDELQTNPVVARLRMIEQEHLGVLKSIDIQLSYFMLQFVCSLLPEVITNKLFGPVHLAIGVSSLPGPHEISFFGQEGRVKDFIVFAPNSPRMGIHAAFVSYGGNFRLTITADKSIVPEVADAEWLLARTIEHVNELALTCKI